VGAGHIFYFVRKIVIAAVKNNDLPVGFTHLVKLQCGKLKITAAFA